MGGLNEEENVEQTTVLSRINRFNKTTVKYTHSKCNNSIECIRYG